MKDFLVLSQTLMVFYLLSVLSSLFLVVEIKLKVMRIAVYISLILIACMNIAYTIYCRRVFPFFTLISLVIVFLYFIAFTDNAGKDKLLTKIYILTVSVLIVAALFVSYLFVSKPETPYLLNGGNTLWDTQTEKLISEAIDKLIVGRTTITIAHRLSTLKNCNLIMAIEHGEVAEIGSAEELLEKKGVYYKLYTLQNEQMKKVLQGI